MGAVSPHRETMHPRDAPRTIAYYLRDCGNLHYFAALRPYLDWFLRETQHDNRVVVRDLALGWEEIPEYAGYAHLFTTHCELDDYDLVLTPTFLRDDERSTRAVQIFHGMSDKPFTYERDFSDYLLCLCVGQRQVDRLLKHPHNRGMRLALVGYPKFETAPAVRNLFRNDKETLIYCPTWRKGSLSSVEAFLDCPEVVRDLATDYNLIVKPHPNIFNPERPHYHAGIVERLQELPGIVLVRSGNVMPWFAQADLFIGDISASGYEWLFFDRPMVFLNPQPRVLRQSRDVESLTFLWQCGEVCADMPNLKPAIARALQNDRYRHVREQVLAYSVHRPRDGGATLRGAEQINVVLRGTLAA